MSIIHRTFSLSSKESPAKVYNKIRDKGKVKYISTLFYTSKYFTSKIK